MNVIDETERLPELLGDAPKYITSWACFSKDRAYRYGLERRWFDGGELALFLMLNPSTADAKKNDPTVERCERYARRWGYAGLLVANIFALRSTDPKALYSHQDPIGLDNDFHILASARKSAIAVCAWGTHGALLGRGKEVVSMLHENGHKLYALRVTAHGHPNHPLYLRGDLVPQRWGG